MPGPSNAIPMLTVADTSLAPTVNGGRVAIKIRSANLMASPGCPICSTRTPNSSPPDARCGVGPALTSDNALGDRMEDRVTRGMPKPIVDCLEVVHIQEEDGETTMAAFDSCDRMLKPILEKGSVTEAGE